MDNLIAMFSINAGISFACISDALRMYVYQTTLNDTDITNSL